MTKSRFSSLGEVIGFCTSNNYTFALYRLPGERQIHCVASRSPKAALEGGLPFPSAPGFIFHPFQPDKNHPVNFIAADIHFSCLYRDIEPKEISAEYNFDIPESINPETPKDLYCTKVQEAVDAVKKEKLKKVILSRVQSVRGIKKQPVELFMELCGMFGAAFLSLVYIPGSVTWLTVSPELLIYSNKKEMMTAALAGTKQPNGNWTEKEIKEQQLVSDYIRKIVEKHCSGIKVSAPSDTLAGSITHLKTSFSAQLDSGFWDLVTELHPTPAVCGIPKAEALKFIAKTELHDRKYYSGYLGPYNIDGETNFFVNLRCAQLMHGRADLFVGGGITDESSPAAEWEETVMKANTLLPVLNPVSQPKVEYL